MFLRGNAITISRRNLVSLAAAVAGAAVVMTPAATAAPAAAAQSAHGLETAAGPSSLASSTSVYVVQGVPATSVDVAIDGRTVQQDVKAEAIVGPLEVSRGEHTVAFRAPSWTVKSTFDARTQSVDVVLHWPADPTDRPAVTIFDNDLSPIASNKGRLIVAHTAVVPPADVRVNEEVLFANIANGEFVAANVPAGTFSVDIVPTGQSETLFGPVDLPVEAQVLTRVFAIGEPTNQSMAAVVQTLPLAAAGSRAPESVNAGSAGLAATAETRDPGGAPGPGWLSLTAVGLAALVAVRVRRHFAIRNR